METVKQGAGNPTVDVSVTCAVTTRPRQRLQNLLLIIIIDSLGSEEETSAVNQRIEVVFVGKFCSLLLLTNNKM